GGHGVELALVVGVLGDGVVPGVVGTLVSLPEGVADGLVDALAPAADGQPSVDAPVAHAADCCRSRSTIWRASAIESAAIVSSSWLCADEGGAGACTSLGSTTDGNDRPPTW